MYERVFNKNKTHQRTQANAQNNELRLFHRYELFVGLLSQTLTDGTQERLGMYPPENITRLLDIFGMGDPAMIEHKLNIVMYFLLDLDSSSGVQGRARERSLATAFARSFLINQKNVHFISGIWCLDGLPLLSDESMDIDENRSQLVENAFYHLNHPSVWTSAQVPDKEDWQWLLKVKVIQTLHAYGAHSQALSFARKNFVQNILPQNLQDVRISITVEDAVLFMTILLSNNLLHEAFIFQVLYCSKQTYFPSEITTKH